ncbi:MAG: O-acetylserine/cysteine efflux transporter [Gammaproteobacteria bacterium]|jgi:O-acetylserine/cysteine efflux transporter
MYIAASIGLEEFPPILFTGIRFALLSIILIRFIKVPRHLIQPLLKIGLVMGVGMYLTLYLSIAVAENISSIAIFSKLELPFALMLGVILLKETIGPKRIAGITIALSGALLISFDPSAVNDLSALFWMAISCGFGAYVMILVRQLGKVHPLTITAWVSLVGAPVLLSTSFIFETGHRQVITEASLTGWTSLVYTAVMSSVLGHSGLYYLLQRYPVGLVSSYSLLSAIFAVIGGVVFLGDQLTVVLVVGGVLILAGVAWINARVIATSEKVDQPSV